MEIDRRKLLTGAACALLTGPGFGIASFPEASAVPGANRWHRLTQSLLDRAGRTLPGPDKIEHQTIEQAIRSTAQTAGRDGRLVIKWLADPAEAVDYLNGLGLDALLRMRNTNSWNMSGSMRPFDEAAFDRATDVQCLAADILRVEEHDGALMAPKLAAKSETITAGASAQELFAVRAKLAQIGWLETSWAAAAAEAVFEVEYALCRGEPEESGSIHHQLTVFEAYEAGLLASWETPAEMICVPRSITNRPSKPGDG